MSCHDYYFSLHTNHPSIIMKLVLSPRSCGLLLFFSYLVAFLTFFHSFHFPSPTQLYIFHSFGKMCFFFSSSFIITFYSTLCWSASTWVSAIHIIIYYILWTWIKYIAYQFVSTHNKKDFKIILNKKKPNERKKKTTLNEISDEIQNFVDFFFYIYSIDVINNGSIILLSIQILLVNYYFTNLWFKSHGACHDAYFTTRQFSRFLSTFFSIIFIFIFFKINFQFICKHLTLNETQTKK